MIGVINPNAGNLRSLINALDSLNIKSKIIESYKDFNNLRAIVLPGVGAFNESMVNLQQKELIEILNEFVLVKKIPFLGICVGLQVLAKHGYEFNKSKGLGWINGDVVKIKKFKDLRIPHMGWNDIKIKNKSILLNSEFENSFYFVHSFHLKLNTNDEIVTSTVFHGEELISSIETENIFGVQFHPEKSQTSGLELLNNFNKCAYK